MVKAINRAMIRAQSWAMTHDISSKAGTRFLAICAALTGSISPAMAFGNNNSGTAVAANITEGIRDAMNTAYGAMRNIGIVVGVCGVALAAFFLLTGGDKGMEKAKKTLLYTAIGFGVLMLAVPLVNFFVSMFSNSTQDLGNVTQFN